MATDPCTALTAGGLLRMCKETLKESMYVRNWLQRLAVGGLKILEE